MPINSLDHLMKQSSGSSIHNIDWQYTTNRVQVANRWSDLAAINSPPGANNSYTGTALEWQSCNSSSSFALPLGPSPATLTGETKHIFYASALSGVATGVPGILMLVDLQGYWPGIETDNTSVQTLSGTPTLRYANGIGCKLYTVVSNTTGTGTNAISISYTNEIGTTGRSLAQTPYGLATSPNGVIYTSGSAAAANANTPSIFLPLAGGDTGVQNVANFTIDTADSVAGRLSLCIAKPLLTIPLSTRVNIVERDFVNQLPSLPRVVDGACLTWLYYAGAATVIDSNFYGTIEYVWG